MAKKNGNGNAPVNQTDAEKELIALQTQQAELQARIAEQKVAQANELKERVLALPAHFSVSSLDEVIKLIRRTTRPVKSGRKSRSKVTPEISATVVKMVKDGKTGAEIVAATGLSLPTIQKIKKANGLVKSRA